MPTTITEYSILIKGIRFRSCHGASASERRLPQDFLVDVEITLPVSVLPAADRLGNVLDYDAIGRLVVEEGTTRTYRLLETFAAELISRLLRETPALAARVSVQKSNPPTTVSVDSATVTLGGRRA